MPDDAPQTRIMHTSSDLKHPEAMGFVLSSLGFNTPFDILRGGTHFALCLAHLKDSKLILTIWGFGVIPLRLIKMAQVEF